MTTPYYQERFISFNGENYDNGAYTVEVTMPFSDLGKALTLAQSRYGRITRDGGHLIVVYKTDYIDIEAMS